MADDQQLRAIEVRVAALLALELDARMKQDARSRSKPRSLDKLLSDAGLEAPEIAPLLGKSPTAVRQALQRSPGRKRKAAGRKSPRRKASSRKKR